MKIKILLASLIIFTGLFISVHISLAQSLGSKELIENAKSYDGKLIIYTGEVIGDLMERGKFAWLNLNDGDNAIGVWAPVALIKNINFTGNYKAQGDVLEIVGEFHALCPEHGGDLDLHAQAMRKVRDGRATRQKINFDKVSLGGILLGVLFFIWILSLFKRK